MLAIWAVLKHGQSDLIKKRKPPKLATEHSSVYQDWKDFRNILLTWRIKNVLCKTCSVFSGHGVSAVASRSSEKQLLTASSCLSDLKIQEACRTVLQKLTHPLFWGFPSSRRGQNKEKAKNKEEGATIGQALLLPKSRGKRIWRSGMEWSEL